MGMVGKFNREQALTLARAAIKARERDGEEVVNFVVHSIRGQFRLKIESRPNNQINVCAIHFPSTPAFRIEVDADQLENTLEEHARFQWNQQWIFTLFVSEGTRLLTFYSEDFDSLEAMIEAMRPHCNLLLTAPSFNSLCS